MFDEDVGVPSDGELLDWLKSPAEQPLSLDEAHTHFLLMHPRMVFLKNLPRDGVVFDIGAGEGQLRSFRDWLGFRRRDLRFVGASLDHGEKTRTYEEFFLGDIEATKPRFKLQPQFGIASQFIEHMRDPAGFLAWLHSVMPPGGMVFLDWPAPHTVRLPSCNMLAEHGYSAFTLNFFDDTTHTRAYSTSEMAGMLQDAGFRIRAGGLISQPYLAESLKHHGIAKKDKYILTMALWLKTRFVAHLMAEKV
jgi:SAM-dependent methyltransferase